MTKHGLIPSTHVRQTLVMHHTNTRHSFYVVFLQNMAWMERMPEFKNLLTRMGVVRSNSCISEPISASSTNWWGMRSVKYNLTASKLAVGSWVVTKFGWSSDSKVSLLNMEEIKDATCSNVKGEAIGTWLNTWAFSMVKFAVSERAEICTCKFEFWICNE